MTVIKKTRGNLVAREVALPSPHTCCSDAGKKETKMAMDCCYLFLSCLACLSEVLPLRWEQVDLEQGTVRLDPGTTKNKEGRLLYLATELKALLWGLWQERQASYPWVFPYKGERLMRIKRTWLTACKKAGLVGKIPHDFRRTAVRNMIRAGSSDK